MMKRVTDHSPSCCSTCPKRGPFSVSNRQYFMQAPGKFCDLGVWNGFLRFRRTLALVPSEVDRSDRIAIAVAGFDRGVAIGRADKRLVARDSLPAGCCALLTRLGSVNDVSGQIFI